VTVKAGRSSARKLARARKLVATVSVSREVQTITATLKKGGTVVGKGGLGRTSGTARLPLRLSKKPKAGTYSLSVVADDGRGARAVRTIKVKVAK
jgi:hypothetical protein